MTVLSQVLAVPSDTANDGQTRLSVPKHSQTSQEVRKTRFDWSQVSSWGLAAGGEALRINLRISWFRALHVVYVAKLTTASAEH